jgi:flavin reductase (DIM6/NTAB) family NADH-FMN oxidoreductase RutF
MWATCWLLVSYAGAPVDATQRLRNPSPRQVPMSPPIELFRRVSTGIYVVGVSHAGRSDAFTAAWLTQVSFEPLLIGLSVNPENFSFTLLQPSGAFIVNVLKKGQLELARHFGTQSGRDVDKLARQRWRPGLLGGPVLLDAAAYLECRVIQAIPAGDHQLIVGQPVSGEVMDNTAELLTYAETGDLDGSSQLFPSRF